MIQKNSEGSKKNARISIITPVYNGAEYMEACIHNVACQQCAGLEHIIVDGGSADGTIDIIERCSREYGHVKWITQKGLGQSAAMNKGIKMAKSGVLGFLNVDDHYEDGIVRSAADIFEKGLRAPAFLAGNCNIVDKAGRIIDVCRPRRMGITDLVLGYDIAPHPVNPVSYFYHRSLHDSAGFYDEAIDVAMDQEFIFRAVRYANVKYMDKVFGSFRYMEGTKTYKDKESGLINERDRAVIKKHIGMLKGYEKVLYSAKYVLYRKLKAHRIKDRASRVFAGVGKVRKGTGVCPQ